MNYLSVCSGVEAASQAWMSLGWKAVAFSEIEPFPCAVLASRFPDVPNLGDMSKIHYNKETKELANGTTAIVCRDGIDLLVGGTPCQSFSVAGKRAGLEGASGLAWHYARLIGEIQPRWFVWENVPGALSSVTYGDQRDFNFLLQQFAVGGNADLGARWNLCWRVVDTQYVRVELFPRAIPQRRRRVFIVGHLATDCGGGCEVLLEQEGLRGDTAPRRVKGQGVAGDFKARVGGADDAINCAIRGNRSASERGKLIESDFTRCAYTVTGVQTDSMAAVKIEGGNSVECLCPEQPQSHRVYSADGAMPCLNAMEKRGGCDSAAVLQKNGVECITPEQPQAHRVYGVSAICVKTANTNDGTMVAVMENEMGTETFIKTSHARGRDGLGERWEKSDVCGTRTVFDNGDTRTQEAICYEHHPQDTRVKPTDVAPTCGTFGNSIEGKDCLVQQYHYAVRRITPIEGERLQGFADNWTRPCFTPDQITEELVDRFVAIHLEWAKINGKGENPKPRKWVRDWLTKISSPECPDGPRYKAIGNSMSVNVMNWIGQVIDINDKETRK